MAQAPAGVVSCGNLEPFFGGMRTRKGDEELRKRVLASYKKLPNGANAAYYETQVLNMDGRGRGNGAAQAAGAGNG
jgi:uncharacterized phage protein gp47/JayE